MNWQKTTIPLVIALPALALLFMEPIAQDQTYHSFPDQRAFLGIPNFMNVISNIPFLLAGVAGLIHLARQNPKEGAHASWLIFFLGVALVFFGSSYYHWAPTDETLAWDRLPMTIGFMGLFTAIMSEYVHLKLERYLLIPALFAGLLSVLIWRFYDDLRFYAFIQGAPLLAIPLAVVLFGRSQRHKRYLIYGLLFYLAAKMVEAYDSPVFALSGMYISGHSLKHILASLGPLSIYFMLRRRSSDRK